MDQLHRMSAYFNEREKKRLEAKTKEATGGVPEMSAEEIRLSCLENNGYETPELNDKLYLHFRGFRRIENLDKYTGVKSIWLDSNGFDKIENLDKLVELRCLYLSKNLIRKIENVSTLTNLTILDLSYNRLTMLENLATLPALQTLNLSYNSLASPEAISNLTECLNLTTIDLTNNRLENNEEFLDIFQKVPKMVALSINGNEITKMPSFRKKMLNLLPNLGYLDRPVEVQERIFAQAFIAGGPEAENQARQDWREQQNQKRINEMNEFRTWQREQQKLREAAKAEGRSLIKEFTPEEQAERKREAEAAAEAERQLLEMGIDKLAHKYWELDSAKGNNRKDILDMATDALLKSAATSPTKSAASSMSSPVGKITSGVSNLEINEIDVEIPIERDGSSAAAAISEVTHDSTRIAIEEDDEEEEPAISAEELARIEKANRETLEAARRKEEAEKKAAEEAVIAAKFREEEEKKALAEQMERERVVHESFEIYKRQLNDKKNTSGSAAPAEARSTWNSAISSNTEEAASNKTLYWSEIMDLELAKLVKAHVFEFDAISNSMQESAKARKLDSVIVHRNPDLLTNEACRLRWAELDASNWCLPAPGVTAKDTVFRINLTDDILERTGGSQPSFEALASMASGSKPNYLKVPAAFPSVRDLDEETDEEKEDLQLD